LIVTPLLRRDARDRAQGGRDDIDVREPGHRCHCHVVTGNVKDLTRIATAVAARVKLGGV